MRLYLKKNLRLVDFPHTLVSPTVSYCLKAEDFFELFPNLLHLLTNWYLRSVYTLLKY